MLQILNISQIVVSLLLIAAILVQQKGAGLSAAFGGSGETYRTKRGLEKGIFVITVILAFLFLALASLNIFLR